jgi:hypothetical protein
MDRAAQWINDIETKLQIVYSWVSGKEDFFPLSISAGELRSRDKELESCELLIRQLMTQAQLYGLKDEDIRKLSSTDGIAKNLRTCLKELEAETHPGFFDTSIRKIGTIINGISIIMSIHEYSSNG